jgi:DNA-binding NtrC family response regulator
MPTDATILIVEDDAGVRKALIEILRTRGYRILTAATVQEAEEARRQMAPGDIGVVIANLHLTADPQGARAMRCGNAGPPSILNPVLS